MNDAKNEAWAVVANVAEPCGGGIPLGGKVWIQNWNWGNPCSSVRVIPNAGRLRAKWVRWDRLDNCRADFVPPRLRGELMLRATKAEAEADILPEFRSRLWAVCGYFARDVKGGSGPEMRKGYKVWWVQYLDATRAVALTESGRFNPLTTITGWHHGFEAITVPLAAVTGWCRAPASSTLREYGAATFATRGGADLFATTIGRPSGGWSDAGTCRYSRHP